MKKIEADRAAVKTLSDEGKSISEIMKKLGRSRHFVKEWRRRLAEKPLGVEDRPRGGRPKKVTPKVALYLKRNMYGKVRASPRILAGELKKKGITVGPKTISRFAKKMEWKPYKMTKTSALTHSNIKHRLRFAEMYGKLKVNDFKNWLFTDEKSFVLYRPPNKQNDRVYCYSPEEKPFIFLPKKSQSIMVWGGMAWNGLTELEFLEKGKKIDSPTFVHEILERALPKIYNRTNTRSTSVVIRRLFKEPKKFVFQQDGAPPHRAKFTQRWLKKNHQSFVASSDWPGNSPDLNPIENLWGHMAQQVADRKPRDLNQMKKIIKEEWARVNKKFLENLVASMPRRIQALVEQKGGITKY
jgi:transposase